MSTNHTGRIVVILAVLYVALSCIFPTVPPSLFWIFNPSQKITLKPNLKPGIDMAGGVSLLYEIKPPEGRAPGDLAEQVMESLKKRVDPDGVRNLIWRPQGSTRLEIQMPLSGDAEQSADIRKHYADARRALELTNVRPAQVLQAVETMTGDARRDRLAKLAMDSEQRGKMFGALASLWDQIQAARESHKAEIEAVKGEEYDALKEKIDSTNLNVTAIEAAVAAPEKPESAKVLSDAQAASGDFPSRDKALKDFESAYKQFAPVKDSIDDAGQLKRLLRGSGVLEFHILVTDVNQPEAIAMRERLLRSGPGAQAGDTMRWFVVDRPEEFHYPTVQYGDKTWSLAYTTDERSLTNRGNRKRWALEDARRVQGNLGEDVVGFRFDVQGGVYFSELTGANINRPLAIMLDDKIISAPNIKTRIGRDGTIDGGENGYTQEELRYLISTLKAGSLPAQLAAEPIMERQVGAALGEDNLRAGLLGCALGLVIVAIFMIAYYYTSGIVATIAVVMNVVLILGVLAAFNATFTLPGIAGIVLTIGAAVDANVLIFERLREEQHRGLPLRLAMRNAYDRAFSAIVDSNATTVIVALILYWLGSEEVKGFGLTLLIGLISSLFTSLYVTKTIFQIMIDKFGVKHLGSLPLTFPRWDKMLQPKVDWMKISPYFYVFSVLFLGIGCWAFVAKFRSGEMLDIDFASGTAVQFELKQPMKIEEIRQVVARSDPKLLPTPAVVAVGKDDRVYEVVTPNADGVAVRDEVLKLMGDRLKLDRESKFQQVGQPITAALKQSVVAIDKEPFTVDGFSPSEASNHMQGAAIVLRELDPPLRPSEIKTRIERQRLQVQAGEITPVYRDFVVVGREEGDAPTNFALVLVSDAAVPFDKDEIKWRDELAAPMWKLVNDAVNRPAQLQGVRNFNASVASETQLDALMALMLSLLVIMAYIWLRFGNLKYGTATVVAMVHDTLLVIAAIGLSHLLDGTAVGEALLIEPFRLNLTLVAAILTIMSYSMIDTIVVFDRIRENRGKFGHLNRQIINDSVNQTLSRTLLTAGTNAVTVASMYIFGGDGIHGFTFVLLVGIVCGTYSSFAIAAPILLIGSKKSDAVAGKDPAVGQLQRAT